MPRHQLSDEQWECIAGLFPKPKQTGRPRVDLRTVVNAILWILGTGSPWRDLPEEYGAWRTIYGHFYAWAGDGLLNEILRQLQAAHAEAGEFNHEMWCLDGTVVRAHRCAAGGGKKTTRPNRKTTLWDAAEADFPQKSISCATATEIPCTPC